MSNSAQLRSSVSTWTRDSSSLMRAATGVPAVGTLWSAVGPGPPPRLEHVARQLGALAGQGRGEDLVAVPGAPVTAARPAVVGAGDGHGAVLVKAQQLREAQLQAVGDLAGHRQRRAGLAALDLREHRRRDAAALGEVAQREPHRLTQRLDARSHHTNVCYRIRAGRLDHNRTPVQTRAGAITRSPQPPMATGPWFPGWCP